MQPHPHIPRTLPRHWQRWTVLLAAAWMAGSSHGAGLVPIDKPLVYADGRPSPSWRMPAVDTGKFLDFGKAPGGTDALGIREALVNRIGEKFYLYYDGAGPKGWLVHLAVSTDMQNWELQGPVLDFGATGSPDSAAACSPWIIRDDAGQWQMFYLGTRNVSPAPDLIPSPPYVTLRASANSPAGPWTKHDTPRPFNVAPGTYYAETASPGHVVRQGGEWLQFFSASATMGVFKRTLGIARTNDLAAAWRVDPAPIVPLDEQIENSSLYFEPSNKTWFLFTNHIGLAGGVEFTDAIWVYWTKDLNQWNAAHKAVVLDGSNCNWSRKCIGMPSVTAVGDKLHIFYDAPGGDSISHMRRSLGVATLQLPLVAR